MNTWLWILRALALIIGIGTLGLTLPKLLTEPANGLPAGFHLPSLSIEWTTSPQEANIILQGIVPPEKIKRDLNLDSWAVVPMYVALFVGLALYLRASGNANQNLIAVGIIVAVLAAGVSDLIENQRTLALINSYLSKNGLNESDGLLLQQKYLAYVVKWAFIALVLAFTGAAFSLRGNYWIGLSSAVAALVMAVGLIRSNSVIEWGFALMGVAATAIGVFLLR